MHDKSFLTFFEKATGHLPYPYQAAFATADELPHLINAPTSAGKTATAILGWLWRWTTRTESTPRRLVYCLPMRVLVEQSYSAAQTWLKNLELSKEIGLHLLMGGEEIDKWHLHPEKPAILIGTQDMLLSRALNRGYAASRFHWPIDFGLLNNDALWIYDEPQLMGNGVSTSAQLAGLRQSLQTVGSCPSLWMSATLDKQWLDTIDFRGKFTASPLKLSDQDFSSDSLKKRMFAAKTLAKLKATSAKDMKDVAKEVLELRGSSTEGQTLVIVNTVDRAKAMYEALQKALKKSSELKLLLVHSRFRPEEREDLNRALQETGEAIQGRIIVATQVVEAGVDISARTLITELAPWSSIVQRIGRCNRTGDDGPGHVYWIDLDDKQSAPYEATQIDFSRQHLQNLEGADVSPKALADYQKEREKPDGKGERFMPFEHRHVLRRRDLLDLFDTSPDLSGNDIDISRFVRSDDPDTDVQVFWREWSGEAPSTDEPTPSRRELCSVPIGDFKKFHETLGAKNRGQAWVWDHLDGTWIKLGKDQIRPGLVILLPATAGGYSPLLGWDSTLTQNVAPVQTKKEDSPEVQRPPEDVGDDRESTRVLPRALTITEHTENVCRQLKAIIKPAADASKSHPPLGLAEPFQEMIEIAARWHDLGKAHDVFQLAIRRINPDLAGEVSYAKSGRNGRLDYRQQHRPHFRHELASTLAGIQLGLPSLALYLIAAHHGRIRLSIRSLPGESPPKDDEQKLFALGIQQNDALGEVDLGSGVRSSEIRLDLSPMKLGSDRSWSALAQSLLNEHGPFVLAYLEAILRAADVCASMKEASDAAC